MGHLEDLHQYQKTKTGGEFRSSTAGVLLQIIEELENMDLSVREIETVLRYGGLLPVAMKDETRLL